MKKIDRTPFDIYVAASYEGVRDYYADNYGIDAGRFQQILEQGFEHGIVSELGRDQFENAVCSVARMRREQIVALEVPEPFAEAGWQPVPLPDPDYWARFYAAFLGITPQEKQRLERTLSGFEYPTLRSVDSFAHAIYGYWEGYYVEGFMYRALYDFIYNREGSVGGAPIDEIVYGTFMEVALEELHPEDTHLDLFGYVTKLCPRMVNHPTYIADLRAAKEAYEKQNGQPSFKFG